VTRATAGSTTEFEGGAAADEGVAATTPVVVQREDRRRMTTEIDEFRNSLVAAVQAELERHASAVVAEVDRLREEGRRERADLRAEFDAQVTRLAQAIEHNDARGASHADKVREALELRLDESEKRQTRRIDDATAGLDQMVQQAARPVLADLRMENEELASRVTSLDANLRRFDEQAARMVTYFNEITQQVETSQEELADTVKTDVASQLAVLKQLVEENDSAVRKFQNDVGQQVTQKLNDAEDRLNNRLLASENRIKEESGQKIAEIDLHVSRVSGSLDESLAVMNDRISAIDERIAELDGKIGEVAASVEGVDRHALDEMKEKMSAAAGEAMLVRIEMERFEKTANERSDLFAVRLTEVETALQDATMDVSTAVQLDRIEELERAISRARPRPVRAQGRPRTAAVGVGPAEPARCVGWWPDRGAEPRHLHDGRPVGQPIQPTRGPADGRTSAGCSPAGCPGRHRHRGDHRGRRGHHPRPREVTGLRDGTAQQAKRGQAPVAGRRRRERRRPRRGASRSAWPSARRWWRRVARGRAAAVGALVDGAGDLWNFGQIADHPLRRRASRVRGTRWRKVCGRPSRPPARSSSGATDPKTVTSFIEQIWRSDADIGRLVATFETSDAQMALAEEKANEVSLDDQAPVVQLVNRIVGQALRDRASDIHVEPLDGACASGSASTVSSSRR
jgi:type II secretory ATPase GspE/PulE/Tfp pilus assembly ATPase PilB-like protein